MIGALIAVDVALSAAVVALIIDGCRKDKLINALINRQLGVAVDASPKKTRIISPYINGGGPDESD